MTKSPSPIYALLQRDKTLTVEEAAQAGVSRQQLANYHKQGVVERLGRGLYSPLGLAMSPYFDIEQLAKKRSEFVVCLLSALRLHNFTTQSPQSLWIAIPHGARLPTLDFGTLACVRLTPAPYEYGVESHNVYGVRVKVYSAAKTVADCYKFRNKIGADVALEALREGHRRKLFTIAELMAAAKVCRVEKVITPHVECLFS